MNEQTRRVSRDAEVLGGTAVFTGTRVPVQTLFDYLAGGQPLDEFLDDLLSAPSNRLVDLQSLMGEAQAKLASANSGDIIRITRR